MFLIIFCFLVFSWCARTNLTCYVSGMLQFGIYTNLCFLVSDMVLSGYILSIVASSFPLHANLGSIASSFPLHRRELCEDASTISWDDSIVCLCNLDCRSSKNNVEWLGSLCFIDTSLSVPTSTLYTPII